MKQPQAQYEAELAKEAELLKENIAYFKKRFDRQYMGNLSLEWKRFRLPEWRRLNEQIAPLARRLSIIEWQLENSGTGNLLPLHR